METRIDGEPSGIDLLPGAFQRWFAAKGWQPRAHQLSLLEKARAGKSVLLIAPTGAGKTLINEKKNRVIK